MFVDDKSRVSHMIDAAKEAIGFATGRSFDDLLNDRSLVLVLLKCLEMMGEASSKVSHNLRMAHSEIDWQSLIKLRHHLVHEYHDIDIDRVWKTIEIDLPVVLPTLEALLQTL